MPCQTRRARPTLDDRKKRHLRCKSPRKGNADQRSCFLPSARFLPASADCVNLQAAAARAKCRSQPTAVSNSRHRKDRGAPISMEIRYFTAIVCAVLPTSSSSSLVYCQQFFEKAADLTFAVNKVDLQNPMALQAFSVERSHRQMTFRVNVERHFILSDPLMRELSNQVAGDPPAEFPTRLVCKSHHIAKELARRDIGRLVEVLFP